MIHAGIEGGSSGSKIVLVTHEGKILADIEGRHTNHWLLGTEKFVERIKELVDKAIESSGICPKSTKFISLGMALSGADSEEVCEELRNAVMTTYPDLAHDVLVCNDTVGSMASATDKGGVIVISGTGSICKLIRADNTFERVGGWSYALGDEGSAYFIAHKGIKIMIDHEEGLVLTDFDLTKIRKCIFDYFQITHRLALLPFFFTKFEKARIAGLTKHYATLARDEDDALCKFLFYDAGYLLARQVAAVAHKVDQEMLNQPGGLPILCIGQVFKSWDLMKEGFLKGLEPKYPRDIKIPEISLMHLKVSSALGAACVSARTTGHPIPYHYTDNTTVFFHHKF